MNQKRALIVRLSSLGDVIFNIPLANVLKENGYEVTWIVSEKGIGVLKGNPAVDEAILAPFARWKKQNFFQNLSEYLKLIKYIRSKHFDIAIDTQMLFKSFIWEAFCGAKRRLVHLPSREFSFLGGNEYVRKYANSEKKHVTEQYLKFAKHLNLDISNVKATLPPSTPESINKINDLLKNIDPNKQIVSVAPATTWVPKHWNKDNWKALIERMGDKYNIIFTGTKNDKDLIEYISDGKHINLAGETNIPELIELFRRSDLVISLDSGSTHLAWASENPKIISIFCCTPVWLYAPRGDENKYIALGGKIECQPCHRRICPNKTNACTLLPTVDEVFDAVQKML